MGLSVADWVGGWVGGWVTRCVRDSNECIRPAPLSRSLWFLTSQSIPPLHTQFIQVEQLSFVERAFVHVDHTFRDYNEHKI